MTMILSVLAFFVLGLRVSGVDALVGASVRGVGCFMGFACCIRLANVTTFAGFGGACLAEEDAVGVA